MSEIRSSRTPESRLSGTSPNRNGNGREDGDHSALRPLVQGIPTFAIGVGMNLFSSDVRQALTNPSTANFTLVNMLPFSLLGLFSSSLASVTFRRKLPSIALYFEEITVFFITSTFASLVCIPIHVQHRWIVFSACMVPFLLRFLNWIFRRMSEIRSSRTPESRLSRTSSNRNGNGREDGDHSALRPLVQGIPTFAFGVAMNLFSSDVRQALTNPSTANSTPVNMLTISLVGLFCSSLASITLRAKLPSIASFEDIPVCFLTSTFASLLCMPTNVRHHWIVILACMVPLLPLHRSPFMLLLRFLNWIFCKIQHQFRSSMHHRHRQ